MGSVQFQPSTETSHTMCTSITILEDNVLESGERFVVILESFDPRVVIAEESSRASVFITDNDEG